MSETAEARLRQHFPRASSEEITKAARFYYPAWLLGGGGFLVDATIHKREAEALEDVERHIRGLWREFSLLHNSTRRLRPQLDLFNRILRLFYDMTGENPQPFLRYSDVPIYPKKAGAIGKMRQNIGRTFPMHHNQRDAEFPQKVHLVECTRDTWRLLTGKEAPKGCPKTGKYREFLAATICFCDRGWSVESAIGAYLKFDGHHGAGGKSRKTRLPTGR
jgi:hypothetical protein